MVLEPGNITWCRNQECYTMFVEYNKQYIYNMTINFMLSFQNMECTLERKIHKIEERRYKKWSKKYDRSC